MKTIHVYALPVIGRAFFIWPGKLFDYIFVEVNMATSIKIFRGERIFGIVLVIIGLLFLIDQFNFDVFDFIGDYFWPFLFILLGLYLIFRATRNRQSSLHGEEFKAFGNTNQDSYEGFIDGLSITHFAGDVKFHLTEANFRDGDNKINMSSFVGDIKLRIPSSVGLKASGTTFLGDIVFRDRKEDGLFNSCKVTSTNFETAPRRLIIEASSFIGDIKILDN